MSKKKLFKISAACAGMLVGLGLASSAFAGAQLAVTSKKVALELTSTTPSTLFTPSTATVVPSFQPGGLIVTGEKIKLTVTNGVIAADVIDICDGTTSVGSVTLSSDSATAEVTLTSDITNTKVYTIKSKGGSGGTSCAASNTFKVKINGGLSNGSTVTLATSNDPLRIDAGPVTLYTLLQQFSAEITPVTSQLSFADAMKKFVEDDDNAPPDTEKTASKAKLLIKDNSSTLGLDDKVNLTSTVSFGVKVTGNLSGTKTKKIGYDKNDDGTYEGSATVGDADITNGYVSFDIAGDKVGTSTDKNALVIEVDEDTVLTPRTFTTNVKTNIAGAIAREIALIDTTSHIWKLSATQYYIPLIKVGSGAETYIKLQSKSTFTGSNGVSVQILASDGSLVTYNIPDPITPGTPKTITGTELKNAVAAAGKSVDGEKGFAAIVTINAPEADVFAYANTCDAMGNCKRIPVKTANGNIVE